MAMPSAVAKAPGVREVLRAEAPLRDSTNVPRADHVAAERSGTIMYDINPSARIISKCSGVLLPACSSSSGISAAHLRLSGIASRDRSHPSQGGRSTCDRALPPTPAWPVAVGQATRSHSFSPVASALRRTTPVGDERHARKVRSSVSRGNRATTRTARWRARNFSPSCDMRARARRSTEPTHSSKLPSSPCTGTV